MSETHGISVDAELPDSIQIAPAAAGCIAKVVIDNRTINTFDQHYLLRRRGCNPRPQRMRRRWQGLT
jgi:hypothetical protein